MREEDFLDSLSDEGISGIVDFDNEDLDNQFMEGTNDAFIRVIRMISIDLKQSTNQELIDYQLDLINRLKEKRKL